MAGTLPEVLQHKKDGDKWYSYIAPEEFHYWNVKNQWKVKNFRDYKVMLLAVKVVAAETIPGTKNRQNFNKSEPLFLDCGVEITSGYIEIKQKKRAQLGFRIDGIYEMNRAMKDLSKITDIDIWQVIGLEISNKSSGGICYFSRHNPDGNGTSLYFYRIKMPDQKDTILYPNVSMADQEFYLGKFKQHFAACECTEHLQKFHGCTIHKDKKKMI